ncbi:MAG: hypothetical protein K0S76_560 [Herbinix sp.]|nr:hypothetical protein [Herbinix sp.]
MKKILCFALLMSIMMLTLVSCKDKFDEMKTYPESEPDIIAGVKDEVFELKLYVDKNIFREDELIKCHATLEYVGEEESITIYHGNPLLGFGLKDNIYFEGGYSTFDELISTTFFKGQPVYYEYVKSGGWSAEDPYVEFYKEFYSERDLRLPTGRYELSAIMNGSFDQDDMLGTWYNQAISVIITVTD